MTSPQESNSTVRNEGDVFKILVATDIHLGFEEKDPIRDQDTFDTFEEILEIAAAEEVDFILLGGDLFHHAQPSPYCIYKCTELLRKYCLGDRPVEIELLSDASHNFQHSSNPTVNYEDPNINISIPVFSIHGNHDDPTGQKQISAIDLLSSAGLLNYFGRCNNYDMVEIEPILLKKGETKLALYGLSHIKDERLGRLFLDKKVKMLAAEDQDNWFNLLVLHQNRATRGVKNFIPDDGLPDFLDLVVWGHEHDCRIKPEARPNNTYISQPGSSVATSLISGEAIPKKVGILKIHRKSFSLDGIELKTVRPFICEELVLKDVKEMDVEESNTLTYSELTKEIVTNKVNTMIEMAKNLGRTGRASELPLIRLNVKYRDERQVFNAIRFGQSYAGRVANPEDMVKCQAIKEPVRHQANQKNSSLFDVPDVLADRVEDLVLKYFSENDILKCFPVDSINEAVKKYIDANDAEAPVLVADHLMKETIEKLGESSPEIEEVDQFINKLRKSKDDNRANFVNKILNDPNRVKKRNTSSEPADDNDILQIDDDDDDDVVVLSAAAKPSTTRGAANSRGGRGSRRPRRAGKIRGN